MLSNRRFLPHSLHRQQRFLIAMLAPLLHVIHPAVHNHQHDARKQLEHLLAGHTLIEYLAEEIYRVRLERGIERIGKVVQLLLYGIQLVNTQEAKFNRYCEIVDIFMGILREEAFKKGIILDDWLKK
jgi:hypothetical protein